MSENTTDNYDEPATAAMSNPDWEAKVEQARAEERRLRAMGLAVQVSANPNWSGNAGHVIGMAMVFEEYVKTGKKPTEHQLKQVSKGHR